MKLDPKGLDAAVKAMYDHQVGVAKSAIDKTKFDSSAMPNIFRRLHKESETSQVLVVSSYIEDRVTNLFQNQLVDLNSEAAKDRLFGSNGPLGTFGGRITMAYHLGWLTKGTVDRLSNFRKVRNIFAHKAFSASYTDQRVRELFVPLVGALELFDSRAVVAAIELDNSQGVRRVSEATEPERYLCSLALLAGDVFRELLVMPEAVRHRVSPGDIASSYDAQPQVLAELLRNMVRCALEILLPADQPRVIQ
ncbi:hypothetical protein LGH82_02545 [Mesorhizobium sp. PAMC28654]|uniref:hypothetical protein n=1 Tax=Mesorhizobium sp. PAMC28654 TaxID=2880934 RepID=UPI001D0B6A58|nr:hypothetical protein [Mesorhizobium sp. PAMC28654]UDL90283.1 hypothetical protein LGH82_02545 [Mesorhizobium sp. PAMC28654]